MERKLLHSGHEHPLIFKAEHHLEGLRYKYQKECRACETFISGPFYMCKNIRCYGFSLHKVCAELPEEMNHPMHSQHPLTLLSSKPRGDQLFRCRLCMEMTRKYGYHCSTCKFDLDIICASASHIFQDRCHQHPLTALQLPSSFQCHICRTEEKGLSYKCNTCLFWVHQNCTVSLPETVKHSYHAHDLTFLQSVPLKFGNVTTCDICYDLLFKFSCVYCCERCMFLAHVNCAKSEAYQSLETRDQKIEIKHDHPSQAFLPVQPNSTELISWFADNYCNRDPITNLLLGIDEISHTDQDTTIKKVIKFFSHEHPLLLIDDQVSEKMCDACALPIYTPFYGCGDCGYFLHKCCTELPNQILHPAHYYQIHLRSRNEIFDCKLCSQRSNGFSYECFERFERKRFTIDIKCASLVRPVKHEAHKHSLSPRFIGSRCNACGTYKNWILQCTTCSFSLCFSCAMMPRMMKHRYDKHPFMLTYTPPENPYEEYICDLCELDLNPKEWFYHCGQCDHFAHTKCMRVRGADSNIKYGKSYKYQAHEHNLVLVSCAYSTYCHKCQLPMRTGYSVGLECIPCDFKIHFECAIYQPTRLPN